MSRRACETGFTLAELLIALAILGLIVTFTIPKVLSSQQSSQNNSVAKELIATISGAYQAYQTSNTASGSTGFSDLTPYVNYVRLDTTLDLDDNPTDPDPLSCSTVNMRCLVMHNGGVMLYHQFETFGNTYSTNAVFIQIDPNGKHDVSGTGDGPGKGLEVRLFYNGKITTLQNIPDATCDVWGCGNAVAGGDPGWFSWN